MASLFQYSFIVRSFEAGIIIALIAPLIGTFLVLRRYAPIADTLSHVSLAGVALGLLLKINPLFTAIGAATLSSLAIERIRLSKKVYGEAALAIFFAGSLGIAVLLISLAHGFNVNLFKYLFGSLVTVQRSDIGVIALLGVLVFSAIVLFYKELVFITFDEEAARVSGIPVHSLNLLLIALAGMTVAFAMPIVGVLLIAALVVIPVVTALLFRRSFKQTILIAEAISLFSVVSGIVLSFYLDLSTGGTIVLIALGIFITVFFVRK